MKIEKISAAFCQSNSSLRNFDANLAVRFGIEQAIIMNTLLAVDYDNRMLLNHFRGRRQVEGVICEEGVVWSRHSLKNLSAQHPYFTPGKIENRLKKLEELGLIECRESLTRGFYWITLGHGEMDE